MSVIQFKEANCKNCYKCIRSCPVKAIEFKNEQARIVEDDCMLCGKCLMVCPQNAKSVKSDVDKVKGFFEKNEKVYASIAPSFVSAFKIADPKKIFHALKRLGFTHIEETAVGAVQVSREYDKLLAEKRMENIISTACPSIVFLVQKYYSELINQLAPVVSPMIAHAKMMKDIYGPRIRVVFIGPCISKKEECNDLQNNGAVDAVITFEELEKWLELEGAGFNIDDGTEISGISNPAARFYPAPGGIIKTLDGEARKNYKCISVDGVDRCISILDSIRNGEVCNYFIEMNSCAGGCLGGPCIKEIKGGFLGSRDRLISYVKKGARDTGCQLVEKAKVEFKKRFVAVTRKYNEPEEATIREILSEIGKPDVSKELNCGACGYSTCREKAIAVYNNKAELHMCLPYMRERAESVSNIIIHSTPNAIIAMDTSLRIHEINLSARKLFHLENLEVAGKSIYEILECADFQQVCDTGESIIDKKYRYDKYNVTVKQTILFVREQKIVIAIIKDISREEKQQQQMYEVRARTVDIAQSVIEKQMRVAQEIASLLGETTAETKMILTQLKKTILSDMGE